VVVEAGDRVQERLKVRGRLGVYPLALFWKF
jgi:hypothetical protein